MARIRTQGQTALFVVAAMALGAAASWPRVDASELPQLSSEVVRIQPLDPEGDDPPPPWYVQGETGVHAIASISKLVALMAILDRDLDMEATTTMEKSDHRFTRTGSRSRLRVGVAYRNRDLVTAALMSSDNRAVLALGRAVGLSREALAAAMNAKVRSLGLRHAHFAEPTGISHDNVAAPGEILVILRAALEYEPIRRLTTQAEAVIRPAGRKRPREVYVNTNRLVRWGVSGILGGKTGFNRKAGHCLTFAIRVADGRRIGVVILGAPTRNALFRDAKHLASWVREAARRHPPLRTDAGL